MSDELLEGLREERLAKYREAAALMEKSTKLTRRQRRHKQKLDQLVDELEKLEIRLRAREDRQRRIEKLKANRVPWRER